MKEQAQDASPGLTFQVTPEVVEAVNAALHLRRPLLLTGRPGSGKSSLIDSVARELSLGRALRWHVTSSSTVADALYRYDAVGRLHMRGLLADTHGRPRKRVAGGAHTRRGIPDIEDYLRLGPLGTALIPAGRPRALLIDEIDKSDIDLPNDLLAIFERGEFEIPELARLDRHTVRVRVDGSDEVHPITRGRVRCREFPFVVLTSNGERDFPPAFLRRCIRLRMPDPTPELLARIVSAHLGPEVAAHSTDLIEQFARLAEPQRAPYATDQLLNAVYMVTGQEALEDQEREALVSLLFKRLTSDADDISTLTS